MSVLSADLASHSEAHKCGKSLLPSWQVDASQRKALQPAVELVLSPVPAGSWGRMLLPWLLALLPCALFLYSQLLPLAKQAECFEWEH